MINRLVFESLNHNIQELNDQEKNIFCSKYKEVNKNHLIYAILVGKKYIGGLSINKNPNKDIYKNYNLNPNISISWFYIDPEFRNKGLGIKLFRYIISKYNKIALTTSNKSSLNSKKIYIKFGFKIIHSYKNTEYWYKD